MTVGELVRIIDKDWDFSITKSDKKIIWAATRSGFHFTSDWKGFDNYTDAIEDFLETIDEIETLGFNQYIAYNTLLL